MERSNNLQRLPEQASEHKEEWVASLWLLDQSNVIREAKIAAKEAEGKVQAEQKKLAEFIRDETSPEIWSLLSPEQQNEIIENQPEGSGEYGLEI